MQMRPRSCPARILTCSKQVNVVVTTVLGLSLVVAPEVSAENAVTNTPPAGPAQFDFGIFWPPVDPSSTNSPTAKPLLLGQLKCQPEKSSESAWRLRLRVTICRATDEAARKHWNSSLAFPDIDWMRYVRVWDADQRWLWPNLPYLLRLHGAERVERYGGVDPGKGVDNDFAAVLIREYGASGEEERATTRQSPLVSAEWHPVDAKGVGTSNIVHVAESDEFSLWLPKSADHQQGMARVWLVYADFLGARPPASWPKTPEFAGGILAFFELEWNLSPNDRCMASIRHTAPKQGTGFNWVRWVNQTKASADPNRTARLSN